MKINDVLSELNTPTQITATSQARTGKVGNPAGRKAVAQPQSQQAQTSNPATKKVPPTNVRATTTPALTGKVGEPAGRKAVDQAINVVKSVRSDRRPKVIQYAKDKVNSLDKTSTVQAVQPTQPTQVAPTADSPVASNQITPTNVRATTTPALTGTAQPTANPNNYPGMNDEQNARAQGITRGIAKVGTGFADAVRKGKNSMGHSVAANYDEPGAARRPSYNRRRPATSPPMAKSAATAAQAAPTAAQAEPQATSYELGSHKKQPETGMSTADYIRQRKKAGMFGDSRLVKLAKNSISMFENYLDSLTIDPDQKPIVESTLFEGGDEAAGLGGNVFKDEAGNPLTKRIDVKDVPTTIKWLEQITGLELSANALGSTGKPKAGTQNLGDLDLGVDANTVGNEAVIAMLTKWCQQQKIPADQIINRPTNKKKNDPGFNAGYIKNAGNQVHFRTPINGNPENGFVQTDFMLMPNLEFAKSVTGYAPGSNFKAADRAILYNSIGKATISKDFPQGVKFDWRTGLYNRMTNELVTSDLNEIAEILLGPGKNAKDLASVESTIGALRNDPKKEEKLKDARVNFASRNQTLPETAKSEHPAEWFRHLSNKIGN